MKLQAINAYQYNSTINFRSAHKENKQKNNKTNLALITGGAVLGGAVILANYNKIFCHTNVKDKFLKTCKTLTNENYKASSDNIEKGIFQADLHSHTNHSDGWGRVEDILNQAAQYADSLNKKTGKKFTFAITDHDRVSGVKEALEIIKANPQKYKNINFVPGVEMSFAFNSDGKVKSGELLAYFINPDSPAIKKLILELNENRNKMFDNCIAKLGKGFSRADMENYFINKDGETFAYNLHYRLRNYAQIKNRINKMAEESNQNPQNLYNELMNGYVFGQNRRKVPKYNVSPQGFDEYLKSIGKTTKTDIIDSDIDKICEEFYPKIVDGKVVSDTENSIEKILETLKDEKDIVFGFAHPYFIAKEMKDYKKEFSDILKMANGKIQTAEIYHQAYSPQINRKYIQGVNDFLLSQNLIPLGGRDNHGAKFLG